MTIRNGAAGSLGRSPRIGLPAQGRAAGEGDEPHEGGGHPHGGKRGAMRSRPRLSHRDRIPFASTSHPVPIPVPVIHTAARTYRCGDSRILRRPAPPVNTSPGPAGAQGPTPSDLKTHTGSLIVAAEEGKRTLGSHHHSVPDRLGSASRVAATNVMPIADPRIL